MNARFRRYAKAGLTTAVTGLLVAGSGLGFAQSGFLPADPGHTPPTTTQKLPPGRGATTATGRATPPAKIVADKPPLGLLQRSWGGLSAKTATKPAMPATAAAKGKTAPANQSAIQAWSQAAAVQTAENTQDESAPRSASKIQATAGVRPSSEPAVNNYQAPTGPATAKTPVEQKLEELYRRDGRTPPPMSIKELPNASAPQRPNQAQVAPATAAKPNLLQRMFPSLARSSTPPAAKPQARTAPSAISQRPKGSTAPGQPAYPHQLPQPQVVRTIPQAAPSPQVGAQETPGLFPGANNVVATARMQEPVQLPLADEAEVDAVKGGQDWEDLSLDDSASRATRVASNDKMIGGKDPSPFSGLTLSPEEAELNVELAEPAAASTAAADPDEDDFFTPRKPVAATPAAPLAPVEKMPLLAPLSEEKGLRTLPVESEPKLEIVKDGTAHPEPKLSAIPQASPPELDERAKQLAALAARPHQRGLKGFCPVTLYHKRQLAEAKPQFYAIHQNKMYTFANAEAQADFEHAPEKYIPACSGKDIVRVSAGEQDTEGSLDHAVWYKGRLYLFASVETRAKFVSDVHQYVPKK